MDDQGHLLGNVTVDDALDVLNEEHAEDLQIAGAGHNDTAAEGRTGDLAWLMRNEAAGGTFVDVWDGFVDEAGKFVITGSDVNGQQVRLRGSDGINLTKAGKRKLAFYAEKDIRKILGDASILVNATVVRVPVFYGHSEAVAIETRDKLTAAHARELLEAAPGIEVVDEALRPLRG